MGSKREEAEKAFRVKAMQERNAEILKLHRTGMSAEDIGQKFSRSANRVRAVCKMEMSKEARQRRLRDLAAHFEMNMTGRKT